MEVEKHTSVREIFEAKNLYRIHNYIHNKQPDINQENILLCHRFHLKNIDEDFAQRGDATSLKDISKFHLDFELLHPFLDGNGRIGRVLVNWQLSKISLPPIIIRSEAKLTRYYPHLAQKNYRALEKQCELYLSEGINKRLAYLNQQKFVLFAQYAGTTSSTLNSLINKAHRQTLPAFRIKGIWNIALPSKPTE